MPKGKSSRPLEHQRKMRPAETAEARESQLISLAIDLAEQQLRDGTASSQVITHYLKLGSTRDKIEREILEKKKDLIRAKTNAYESAERIEELYNKAMQEFRMYSGEADEGDYEDDDQ